MKRTSTRLRWLNSKGYTLVEVMIFMAVSGALMASAMGLINGQEEKTRFAQSVRTFEQNVQDIFNDVSTGFYSAASPENVNFRCDSAAAGSVSITNGNAQQGTSHGCVFLGKIIQLTEGSAQYSVYTLVNARTAETITDIKARMLGTGSAGGRGIVDTKENQADLEIRKIISRSDATRSVKGLGLISDFSIETPTGDGTVGNASRTTLHEYLGDFGNSEVLSSNLPASSGVIICLEQSGGGRQASVEVDSRGVKTGNTLISPWSEDCN